MKERLFRFKQFSVSHSLSAMKVGVDAVLLGAWADVGGMRNILDIGTGCGVIALALAQRNPSAKIYAIDIDELSTKEAQENFNMSPWKNNLSVETISFSDFVKKGEKFDLVVSNPPFFNAGVNPDTNNRMKARHYGTLSPFTLIENSDKILSESGRLAMITPSDIENELLKKASEFNLTLRKALRVKGTFSGKPKRLLTEFRRGDSQISQKDIKTLTINDSNGEYTEEYINLTREYYLKF